MNSRRQDWLEDDDDLRPGPVSPFDPAEADEDDLWFLPGADADPDPRLPPLPRSDRRGLFDAAEWRRAQGDLSGELAGLACRFGAFDARLAALGEGARHRLALREAAELSWWAGDRIGAERLTLWVGQRLGGAGEDGQALARAGWAMRRLAAGQGPSRHGWRDGISALLGRNADTGTDDIGALAEVMEGMETLHPIAQAAVLFHAWRLASSGPARDIEAAVLAACHGAAMGQGAATFLPISGAAALALRTTGSAHARLAGWIEGADQATRAALGIMDRLAEWQATARAALADLSGRVPSRLAEVVAAWPLVSAPLAEELTGASRAAVQRNLDRLVGRGLIREVTGQGRYRLWAARL